MSMYSQVRSRLSTPAYSFMYLSWCVVGVMVAGCSDPRYQAKQSVRNDRIYDYGVAYRNRESQSTGHLMALEDERKSLGIERDEKLKNRLIEVPRHEQVRAEELRIEQPARHERVRSILGGKPEKIRDAWADLVY